MRKPLLTTIRCRPIGAGVRRPLGAALTLACALPVWGQAPSFRNDVIPTLTRMGCNSGACHGSQYGKGGFKLSLLGFDVDADYDAIAKAVKGRRVNLGSPAESLILRKPTLTLPHGGGLRFAPRSQTYNLLLGWIAGGVPAPTADDPRLVSLAASTESRTLQPGETFAVQVEARFSDGSVRNVTEVCRLEILKETVAEVSPQGEVTAKGGGGRTALVARYMDQTAVVHISVPYVETAADFDFQPRNYIDELAAVEWKQLGLRPAGLSSDTQFLRRVYLDLIGVLPTEEEIRKFIADTNPEKRARVIDELLERPEYEAFWTLRWGDILRVTRQGMGLKPMWNFHRWLKRNHRENRPIDEMVREILVARGQPESQDVAAFFKMTRSPEEAAEAVSVAFLGLRLGCAKCHHHPFEKWGQEDYYGMAAFFARVDQKPNLDFAMPTLRLKPTGFVRHPRTHEVIRPKTLEGEVFGYEGDPREHLAEWLTSKRNPWFAPNFANRYWGYLMGRGLVEPLDDMRETTPPSMPVLLGALSEDFRRSGFDQKHMLRTIANSRVYQLDSEPPPGSRADGSFYTFYAPKRLMAEQLLDAVNYATHVPDTFAGLPENTRAIELPDPGIASDFLDTFGRSRRLVPCECSRDNETNLTQVLHLMNGPYLQKKIASPEGRVAALFPLLPTQQVVSNLYYATVSRPPSDWEMEQAVSLVGGAPSSEEKRQVLEDLLWVLLNSREFLFNH